MRTWPPSTYGVQINDLKMQNISWSKKDLTKSVLEQEGVEERRESMSIFKDDPRECLLYTVIL